eukprot:202381-Chlamydomonas_euryale.AAC.1
MSVTPPCKVVPTHAGRRPATHQRSVGKIARNLGFHHGRFSNAAASNPVLPASRLRLAMSCDKRVASTGSSAWGERVSRWRAAAHGVKGCRVGGQQRLG